MCKYLQEKKLGINHMKLLIVAFVIFLFNIPFGYWRSNVKKFSLQWVMAIHLPVPFVIALRYASGIGFAFITYPVLVTAFFLGQFSGSKIKMILINNEVNPLPSCLPCDIVKGKIFTIWKR